MTHSAHDPHSGRRERRIEEELRSGLSGQVLTPVDDRYDAARQLWNGIYDKRPALYARCASREDVAHAVRIAADHDLPLSVRCGGHSGAGHALVDGGLAIDLTAMNDVHVDPERRTAVVGGGTLWRDLDAATHHHGLATTGPVISSVGVGGSALGGGVGWLMRSCGMTCDNLRAAEVVVASGDVLRVDASEHADLLWGLKGGGGNFGVVTRFELSLHPVHTVLGGMVAHTLDDAAHVLRTYRDFMVTAPDHLAVFGVFFTTPDGVPLLALMVCDTADPDPAKSAARPLLSYGSPVMNAVGAMPYPELQGMLDEGNPPGPYRHWRGEILAELSDDVIDRLVAAYREAPSRMDAILIESYGGAAGRVPPDDTAFVHRDAAFGLVVNGAWTDPGETSRNVAWVDTLADALRAHATGAYVNYLAEASTERVREAYGRSAYERLSDLKAKYDPGNLFRVNQNIPPP